MPLLWPHVCSTNDYRPLERRRRRLSPSESARRMTAPPTPRRSCSAPERSSARARCTPLPPPPPPPPPPPARPLEGGRARWRAVPSGPGCGPAGAIEKMHGLEKLQVAWNWLQMKLLFSNQLRVPSGPGCGALWAARGPAQGCAGCGPLGRCSLGLTDRPIWVRVFCSRCSAAE